MKATYLWHMHLRDLGTIVMLVVVVAVMAVVVVVIVVMFMGLVVVCERMCLCLIAGSG
jgi:hypothetical protein